MRDFSSIKEYIGEESSTLRMIGNQNQLWKVRILMEDLSNIEGYIRVLFFFFFLLFRQIAQYIRTSIWFYLVLIILHLSNSLSPSILSITQYLWAWKQFSYRKITYYNYPIYNSIYKSTTSFYNSNLLQEITQLWIHQTFLE